MPDPNTEHGLRVQLATAVRERDEARRLAEKWARIEGATVKRGIRADADALSEIQGLQAALANANAEKANLSALRTKQDDELVRLRTALQDIVTLCMDVPATEDWRAKVGDKARKALHGEAAWQTK